MLSTFLFPIGSAAAIFTGFVFAARAGWFVRNSDLVEKRYTRQNSCFVDIDGTRIHYVDEGEGPVVLLLHGSYLDLGAWDAWAPTLQQDFRVVRIDRSAFGLTGRDPSGRYSYERETELVVAFAARIGLTRYALVGASSGGTAVCRIAHYNREAVSAVVVINFPFTRAAVRPTRQYALSIWIRDQLLRNYQPGWHIAWTAFSNLSDRSSATPVLLKRLADQANVTGKLSDRLQLEKHCSSYSNENRLADFAGTKAPALLIWGQDNHLLTVDSGRAALEKLGSVEKKMVVIEGASHWIPIEKPLESLTITRKFLLQFAT